MRHHVFERDEVALVANAQEARDALSDRDLDARDEAFGPVLGLAGDQQIERQIRNERKRVGRVHRERRDQRKDVAQIAFAQLRSFTGVEIGPVQNADVLGSQQIEQLPFDVQAHAFEVPHPGVALVDLLLRRAAVDGHLRQAGRGLQFQAADALHEEFVEV